MIKHSLLNNGIKLVTEQMSYVNSVSIGFWIKVGSRNENEQLQGISHFIEHLLFKGTTSRTSKQIAEELETVGGSLNAFTSREYTCIYARVLKEDLCLAIDLLCDMLLNSTFDLNEIEKEKNVVLEEIMMYEDTPDELIHDLFTQKVWHGHSLGRAILGTKETVMGLNRENIIEYFKEYFIPQNIVISAAGNLEHDAIKEELENKFKDFKVEAKNVVEESGPEFKSLKFTKIKKTEQTHICLGTKGVSQNSDKLYHLMVFNNILGGGVSSRLFQSVRENMGLAYSIYSYMSSYSDQGLFIIYAGTSPKNVNVVLDEIFKQTNSLSRRDLTLDELQRTKNQLRGNILLNMENVSHRMSRIGRTMMSYGRVVTAEEVIEKINKVSIEDLYELTNILADFDKYSLVSIGPNEI